MSKCSLCFIVLFFSLCLSQKSFAEPHFKKAAIIIFENTDYSAAKKQPTFKQIASEGFLFTHFHAITHPSQPNYIALVSGSKNKVNSNDNVDIDANHLADLIEAKGLTWKTYAEGYPGNCFLGATSGKYARKHNPFISFKNIQNNPDRCANIVPSTKMKKDLEKGTLPDFIFYVPDMDNSGHDTDVKYADQYIAKTWMPLLKDPKFMEDRLVVITFDEGEVSVTNRIFTAFYGDMVKHGGTSDVKVNLFSLLRLIEDEWDLGTLGKKDLTAPLITDPF